LRGLGDLSQILDERAYAQADAILRALSYDLSKFVITDAYRRSVKALTEHGFVLLLGEPAATPPAAPPAELHPGPPEAATGSAADQAHDPDPALAGLVDATVTRPDDPSLWHERGAAYMKAGQFAAAADCAERVTQLLPDSPTAWSNLGRAYRKLGRSDEARQAQEHALALRPGYAGAEEELAKTENDRRRVEGADDSSAVRDVDV
jgi:tetratricopeptide (TPR) repeat protein